jgi:hypothetical protein
VVNESFNDVHFTLWCHLAAEIDFLPILTNRKLLRTFKQFEIEGEYLLNASSKRGSRIGDVTSGLFRSIAIDVEFSPSVTIKQVKITTNFN